MSSLIRGTTPSLKFTYSDIDMLSINVAYMTIRQLGSNIIEKDLTEATVGSNYLLWKLTQEETLLIKENAKIEVQCRLKLNDGTAIASKVYELDPVKILKEGEI